MHPHHTSEHMQNFGSDSEFWFCFQEKTKCEDAKWGEQEEPDGRMQVSLGNMFYYIERVLNYQIIHCIEQSV